MRAHRLPCADTATCLATRFYSTRCCDPSLFFVEAYFCFNNRQVTNGKEFQTFRFHLSDKIYHLFNFSSSRNNNSKTLHITMDDNRRNVIFDPRSPPCGSSVRHGFVSGSLFTCFFLRARFRRVIIRRYDFSQTSFSVPVVPAADSVICSLDRVSVTFELRQLCTAARINFRTSALCTK